MALPRLGRDGILRPGQPSAKIGNVRTFLIGIAALAALAFGAGDASSEATHRLTARQVVAHLRAGGLPIGRFKVYDRSSDGNRLLGRPGEYTSKVNFRDRRIHDGAGGFAVSSGGSVEVFARKADAQRRVEFIVAVTRSPAVFAEYDYLIGSTVVRISHVLRRAQAVRYATAVRRLG